MSLYNHQLTFRPLLGGVEIYVPRVNEVGTLGFLARDGADGDQRWLVSCYHVLVGGPGSAPVLAEGVLQPAAAPLPAAFVDALRCDPVLDCAAAKIAGGVGVTCEILGVGPIGVPADALVGMRVIKSGAATGITEGVILEIQGDDVIIGIPEGFDPNYDLSRAGDSGALWLSREDFSPVALHISEMGGPQKRVKARRILSILAALRFRVA